VDFLETDRLNTTTNRVENYTENHTSTQTHNTTDTSDVVRDNSTTIAKDRSVNLGLDVNVDAKADIAFDASEDYTRDIYSRDELTRKNVYEDVDKKWIENKDVNVNVTDVEMTKKLSFSKDIRLDGDVTVSGELNADHSVTAVVEDKQYLSGNTGVNHLLENTAKAGDNVLQNASGDIGLNMSAGDNNLQDNASAISAAGDADFVFGVVDAEVFVKQSVGYTGDSMPNNGELSPASVAEIPYFGNSTTNIGTKNYAALGSASLQNASGNIGVNIVSGNNNLQKNNLAAATGNAGIAEASVNTQQHSHGNYTRNEGKVQTGEPGQGGSVAGEMKTMNVTFKGPISGDGVGNASGKYWGTETGIFNEVLTNTYTAEHNGNSENSGNEGSIGWHEEASVELLANFTGDMPYYEITSCGAGCANGLAVYTENVASLSDNAMQGASGNIGVNIGAGTGNMASNSLSMAVTRQ